jgi:hypothetical protein
MARTCKEDNRQANSKINVRPRGRNGLGPLKKWWINGE